MTCSICLKEINIHKSVWTPCHHRFCSYCFFRWIYTSKTCPLCRRILIAEANSEEKEELVYLRRVSQQEVRQVNRLTDEIEEKQLEISELYAEVEFLSNIKNQKKKEIDEIKEMNEIITRQQRVIPTIHRRRRRRRMGMMWA